MPKRTRNGSFKGASKGYRRKRRYLKRYKRRRFYGRKMWRRRRLYRSSRVGRRYTLARLMRANSSPYLDDYYLKFKCGTAFTLASWTNGHRCIWGAAAGNTPRYCLTAPLGEGAFVVSPRWWGILSQQYAKYNVTMSKFHARVINNCDWPLYAFVFPIRAVVSVNSKGPPSVLVPKILNTVTPAPYDQAALGIGTTIGYVGQIPGCKWCYLPPYGGASKFKKLKCYAKTSKLLDLDKDDPNLTANYNFGVPELSDTQAPGYQWFFVYGICSPDNVNTATKTADKTSYDRSVNPYAPDNIAATWNINMTYYTKLFAKRQALGQDFYQTTPVGGSYTTENGGFSGADDLHGEDPALEPVET